MAYKWKDNSVRILALFIAIVLWFYVTNEQNPVTNLNYNVPLVAEQPEGYIVKGLPDTVSVRVKGARSIIGTLRREDFTARVNLNLSGAGVGEYDLQVQVTTPPGVELVQISPNIVRVEVDQITSKNVPVAITLKGDPSPGRQAGEPLLRPPTVTVQGPGKLLDQINQVGVTIDITGATDVVEQDVSVTTGVDGVTVSPGRVHVTVPVTDIPNKNLPVRIRLTGEPAAGYVVDSTTVRPSSVQVLAGETVLQNLTAVSTMAVDITGVSDDVEREAVLLLPDGARQIIPNTVLITVRITPVEEVQPPLGNNPGGNNDNDDTTPPSVRD